MRRNKTQTSDVIHPTSLSSQPSDLGHHLPFDIGHPTSDIARVSRTVPLIPHATAEKYLKSGNYLWNAGIFVWNIDTITERITKYKPQIASQMDEIVNSQLSTLN